MLILIAPKFHLRHSEPRATDTDSATIPVYRYYRYRRYYYIIFADIVTVAATIHYIYSRSLLLLAATLPSPIIFKLLFVVTTATFIIFSLPPVVLRLPLMPRRPCRCRLPPPLRPLPLFITTAAVVANTIRRSRHRRYYSNIIATDVIANALAAVISTAVTATVAVKF